MATADSKKDDIMGFAKYKGHYCLKCAAARDEAIGVAPRCEACGSDLKQVEVTYTPSRFAGYIFLLCLLISMISLAVSTFVVGSGSLLLMFIIFGLLAITFAILAVVCMLVDRALMKEKMAKSIPDRPFGY
jgi:uncharacterized protein (DUF983 family)